MLSIVTPAKNDTAVDVSIRNDDGTGSDCPRFGTISHAAAKSFAGCRTAGAMELVKLKLKLCA